MPVADLTMRPRPGIAHVLEQAIERQGVDAVRRAVLGEGLQRLDEVRFGFRLGLQAVPLHVEPLTQHGGLGRGFGCLDQAQGIAWAETQSIGGEGKRPQNDLLWI
jgi:hypothetical protein